LWSALTSHGVKSDAEKVIYSLSTAYYTLFHEYDLDQFYYTGLNRNQTPVVGVFEESDEEEELVQDIIQEQILLPLEKVYVSNSTNCLETKKETEESNSLTNDNLNNFVPINSLSIQWENVW
jgi:hypothetical protein